MDDTSKSMSYPRINLRKYIVASIWFGCNNNCSICMLSSMRHGLVPIGFDNFCKAILYTRTDGRFDNLILSGGEVTTFPDLDCYVDFASSLGWFKKIQIQTNGRKLSNRAYVDHLVAQGVNEFFISIHGFENTHDATTQVAGSFADTVMGIRNLGKHKVNVISNTVLTKNNLDDIVPLFSFLAKESVSEMQLWNFFPMEASDRGDRIVDLGSFRDLVADLAPIAEAAGKPVVFKSFPHCFSVGGPLSFDSLFPATVLPDLFWEQFHECGFGQCFYRTTEQCKSRQCWGLSSAYLRKYGDERRLVRPIEDRE